MFNSKTTTTTQEASYKDLNVLEARKMLKNKDIELIDVRTPIEVSNGKIQGAIHINVTSPNFTKKVSKLDKNKAYIIYCRSGRRSISACNIMKNQGFVKLYNLKGGFNSWN